jgi:tetratricopeptide (TPR) repeat protein
MTIKTWPLWLVSVTFVGWRMTATGFDGPQTYDKIFQQHDFSNLQLYADHFSYRLYTFLATLPAYAKLIVWPSDLHMERSFPVFVNFWQTHVVAGAAMVIAAAIVIIRDRHPALSWGLLWFGASLFPNTGLIFPMNAQFLEHWMYVPTIGLVLGVVEYICDLSGGILKRGACNKKSTSVFMATPPSPPTPTRGRELHGSFVNNISIILITCIAILFAIRTAEQNVVWHDAFSFYGNIFKYHESSARAHNNLAMAYSDRGDYIAAVAEYEKAIALTDTYAETHHNLALTLLQMPDADRHIPDVIAHLQRATDIDPNFYRSWDALATIYDHLGDTEDAKKCRKALETIMDRR